MSRSTIGILISSILFLMLLMFHFLEPATPDKPPSDADHSSATQKISSCKGNENFITNFSEAVYLANGMQGSVYKYREDILKVQDFDIDADKSQIRMFEKEVEILDLLKRNPYVVTMKGACYNNMEGKVRYYILLEYCEQDFEPWINTLPKSVEVFYELLIHLTSEMLNINQHKIYHVDNNIGNFMICGNRLKLIDFGLGAVAKSEKNSFAFFEIRNLQILFNDIAKLFSIHSKEFNDLLTEMRNVGKFSAAAPYPKITMASVHERLVVLRNDYVVQKRAEAGGDQNYAPSMHIFLGDTNRLLVLPNAAPPAIQEPGRDDQLLNDHEEAQRTQAIDQFETLHILI